MYIDLSTDILGRVVRVPEGSEEIGVVGGRGDETDTGEETAN